MLTTILKPTHSRLLTLAAVVSQVIIPREAESSHHRNTRSRRQAARGIVAAGRLGFALKEEVLAGAKKRLAAHHGTPKLTGSQNTSGMNPWGDQQMMYVPMQMGNLGGYEDFSMGKKAKGGKGAKAGSGGKGQAQGKGGMSMMMCQPSAYSPDLAWRSPQPSFPCIRCHSKDHYKNQCPHRNHKCTTCNKTGHLESACRQGGSEACQVCGMDNHTTAECRKSHKTCNNCGEVGHLATMCKVPEKDKKLQTSTAPAPKSKDEPAQGIWFCPHCSLYHGLHVLKCTGCNRKQEGADTVAAKPVNARTEAVNAWSTVKPEDGDVVMAAVDPELEKEQKNLEAGISAMKVLGEEAKVKELEDKLKSLIQKKSAVQSPVKACMSVSKSLNDAMEKAARQVAQAEQKLEKVTSVKSDLEKKHTAHKKSLKEEYEEKAKVSQLAYEKEKLRLDEEERQEKLKLEEAKRVTTADVAQKQLALGNVSAAASGSQQKGGTGQQSAGAAAVPGARCHMEADVGGQAAGGSEA